MTGGPFSFIRGCSGFMSAFPISKGVILRLKLPIVFLSVGQFLLATGARAQCLDDRVPLELNRERAVQVVAKSVRPAKKGKFDQSHYEAAFKIFENAILNGEKISPKSVRDLSGATALVDAVLLSEHPDLERIPEFIQHLSKGSRKSFEKQMKGLGEELNTKGFVSPERISALARWVVMSSLEEPGFREKYLGMPDVDTWIERRVRFDLIEKKFLEAFESRDLLDPMRNEAHQKWLRAWPRFKRSAFRVGLNLLFLSTVHQPYLLPSNRVGKIKIPPELLETIERDGLEAHRSELKELLGGSARFDVAYNSSLRTLNTILMARLGLWALQVLPGTTLALYQQSRVTDDEADRVQKEAFKADPIREEALKRFKESFEMINGRTATQAEVEAYLKESGIMDPTRISDEQLKVDYSLGH